jgi:hypothetical protein
MTAITRNQPIPRSDAACRTTTRVRGLAPWSPQQPTLKLLDTVRAVLAEYRDHLPLTIRQIFYRLVGAHNFPKDERAYSRLVEHLNRARRDGRISFDAIRDDDAEIVTRIGWNSPRELIEEWQDQAKYCRLDRQQDQQSRLLFTVEARGMKPQIEAVADDYGVPVIASGGFDSLTAKYQLAGSLGEHHELTEVLHIGDHDPSGVHLFTSMADDIKALICDRRLSGEVAFLRLHDAGHCVVASDIEPRGEGITRIDFLHDEPPEPGLLSCSNPPNNRLTAFITRGLQLLDSHRIAGLVLLVRYDALTAASRAAAFDRASSMVTCCWRPVWVEGTSGNGRWSNAWVCWLAECGGPPRARWVLASRKRQQFSVEFAS